MLILEAFQRKQEWRFLFLNIFSRSRDIQVFVQKLMMSQIVSVQIINHKIKNISENIAVMLLKLGTSNVPLVRHKMTPTVLLP